MEVRGNIEGFHPFPERPIAVLVEIIPVGLTDDHYALEAEVANRAFQLDRPRSRVLERYRREPRGVVRVCLDGRRELIIRFARKSKGGGGIEHPLNRTDAGEDREVDPGLRHGFEPTVAQVGEQRQDLLSNRLRDCSRVADSTVDLLSFVQDKMLFEGNFSQQT